MDRGRLAAALLLVLVFLAAYLFWEAGREKEEVDLEPVLTEKPRKETKNDLKMEPEPIFVYEKLDIPSSPFKEIEEEQSLEPAPDYMEITGTLQDEGGEVFILAKKEKTHIVRIGERIDSWLFLEKEENSILLKNLSGDKYYTLEKGGS